MAVFAFCCCFIFFKFIYLAGKAAEIEVALAILSFGPTQERHLWSSDHQNAQIPC